MFFFQEPAGELQKQAQRGTELTYVGSCDHSCCICNKSLTDQQLHYIGKSLDGESIKISVYSLES
jgi:hypothetical protein